MNYLQGNPLTIVNVLQNENETRKFVEFMIFNAAKMCEDNRNDPEFIPPIVYSDKGKSFNVDYNFMVYMLAWFAGVEEIEHDFMLHKNMEAVTTKYAGFLVVSLLEDYFELVWLNSKEVDISRYKSSKKISIERRFFYPVCIQNGNRVRYLKAIPFNKIRIKRFISDESFSLLCGFTNNKRLEQIVFGERQMYNYKKTNGILELEHVFC